MPDTSKHRAPVQRLVQFGAFCAALDVSKSTGWRKVQRGEWKPPLNLGGRIRAYPVDYLDEVIEQLVAEQEAAE
jgi:predicted DNA-binding transcriptional regulator AlpA